MQEAWRFLLFGLALSAFLSINLVTDTIPELAWAQQEKTIRLEPTDDAYVAADLNDPQDEQGLQQLHTGDLDFLKLWYAWNVTENQERITTVVYLKFDLTEVDPREVESAELNMQPFISRLTAVSRGVELVKVPSNDWNETAITYQDRPFYPSNATISSRVSIANNWYSWNLTEYVKESAGSALSVAMGFENIYQNTEELLTFYSKESANKTNVPYLEIALVQPIIAQQKIDQTTFSDLGEYLPIIGGVVAAIVGGGAVAAFLIFRKRARTISRPSGKPPTVQTGTKAKCFLCGKIIPRGLPACPFCGKNPRKPRSYPFFIL